jgi:4-carboxymuconolactone decarboxylase
VITPLHGRRIEPLAIEYTGDAADGVAGGARPVHVQGTLAHSPQLMRQVSAFGSALFQDALISPREREIVVLRVGWRCESRYEFGQHTMFGRAAGLTDTEIARLAGGPGQWSREDAALVAMVDELCECNDITEPTWVELTRVYSPRQLVELVLLAGYYRMVSGLLNAAGVELEPWTPGWPTQ